MSAAAFDFELYLSAGFNLVPLEGKRPAVKNWTKRELTLEQLTKIASNPDRSFNFGAILTAEHIVIDVDPRNFSDSETWRRFVKLHNLQQLLKIAPTVKTGGGGWHYYFKKPESINVLETIDGFDGVEFKSNKRQVVIPGSIHPTTEHTYEWFANREHLQKLPELPDHILRLITRPHIGTDAFSLSGQFSVEDIGKILDALDVEQYRDHDDWFRIMTACHHASAGHARQEFINWSTSDLRYKNDDHIIGRRWDSLHFSMDNNITYRTLRYELKKIGRLDAITELYDAESDLSPAVSVQLGFISADSTEQMGPFEYLNNKFCSVMLSTKTVLYHSRESDPNQWTTTTKQSFEQQYGGVLVEPKGAKKPISIVKAWYMWRHQRRAMEAIMDIEGRHRNNPQILNLWRGWATKPNGDEELSWDYLETLIRYGLCDGNDAHFEYILNWAAFLFQKPHILPEVALVFTGKKGTGKGTFGKILDHIIGETHSIQVTSPDVFVGRFNSHMDNKVLIFADEAVSPQSEVQNSRLKAMITEQNATSEQKGVEAKRVRNYLHVVIASNNPTPVMVSPDERRYAMFEVSDAYRKDTDFFGKLYTQMENGGYEKFMFDMMVRNISGWHPREDVPTTASLTDQKLASMDPIEEWWICILNYEVPHPSNINLNKIDTSDMSEDQIVATKVKHDWSTSICRFFRDEVKILFYDYVAASKTPYSKYSQNFSSHTFWKKMRELTGIPSTSEKQPFRDYIIHADNDMQLRLDPIKEPNMESRAQSVEFPSLIDCRIMMDQRYAEPFNWVDISDLSTDVQ